MWKVASCDPKTCERIVSFAEAIPEAHVVKNKQALAGCMPVILSGKRKVKQEVKSVSGTVFPVSSPREVGITLPQIARFLLKLCVDL